ncbi:AI-2E family transporter [Noviherbaspirillum sp.]|uniref:AI-2E family transporter n=1 Tax=Noviherbaspirillum sp. TaxID=1926288 RepID=UPI002FE043D5
MQHVAEVPVTNAVTDMEPATTPLAPSKVTVNARGLCLTILAVVAVVFALQWAQKFLIPLTFGILIAYTLNPLVAWMERIRIPRLLGTCAVMLALVTCIGQAGYSLRDEFKSIAERLPAAAHQLSRAIKGTQNGQASTMQKMQAAATEIEAAAGQAAGALSAMKRSSAVVPASSPLFKLNEWLWTGSVSAAGFIGQTTVVIFLVFFLLLSGDTFKRMLMKLTGPSLSNKKIAINILVDVNSSVQRYMFMLLVTNTMLAVLMWVALRWIGLENAGAWAVAAGLLHIIPYFGPFLIAIATGLTAFMQFDSFSMMLFVLASTLGIATLVGTFVTTWMTGRIAKMNAAAVFVVLLFWGWLWGMAGMLLGIPIIVIVKVIAERIEGMQPIAELLGE